MTQEAVEVLFGVVKELAKEGPVAEFFRNLFGPEVFDMKAAAADGAGGTAESTQIADAEAEVTTAELAEMQRLIDELEKASNFKLMWGGPTDANWIYIQEKAAKLDDILWDLMPTVDEDWRESGVFTGRLFDRIQVWNETLDPSQYGSLEYYNSKLTELKDIAEDCQALAKELDRVVDSARRVA